MRAPVPVRQFAHPFFAPQSLPSLIESSPRLSYASGNFAEKKNRKTQEKHTDKQYTRLPSIWKGKNTRSPSRIQLLGLLGTPCWYPSLLLVLRRSHKLLASSGLCGRCCFFVVYPDVCLKKNSGPLLRTCATEVQKPPRLA